jgi:hypothetical protein
LLHLALQLLTLVLALKTVCLCHVYVMSAPCPASLLIVNTAVWKIYSQAQAIRTALTPSCCDLPILQFSEAVRDAKLDLLTELDLTSCAASCHFTACNCFSVQLSEALRDAKLALLKELKHDQPEEAAAAEQLISELLAEAPGHLPLLLEILKRCGCGCVRKHCHLSINRTGSPLHNYSGLWAAGVLWVVLAVACA